MLASAPHKPPPANRAIDRLIWRIIGLFCLLMFFGLTVILVAERAMDRNSVEQARAALALWLQEAASAVSRDPTGTDLLGSIALPAADAVEGAALNHSLLARLVDEARGEEDRVAAEPVMAGGDVFALAIAWREGAEKWEIRLSREPIWQSASPVLAPWMYPNITAGAGPVPADAHGIVLPGLHDDAPYHLTWTTAPAADTIWESAAAFKLAGGVVLLAIVSLSLLGLRRHLNALSRSVAHVEAMAALDPLCGLPNRKLFSARLDQELARFERFGPGIAVIFLDLDRFKEVNDTYGHQAGDDLLRQVGSRLGAMLRAADTLSRFGGDEFAIIQTDLYSGADAQALAQRILDALTRPFDIAGSQVIIGVSMGIALAPQNASDRDGLMRLADIALYDAKNEGRNRFRFFDATMNETMRMRKAVAEDLRRAITEEELVLHYQPIFSAKGDRIVGLEALVRWHHPVEGAISPVRFIPLAEESGLIIPLGEWVLRRACEDARRWPDMRIAINISPIQFRQRNFADQVLAIVRSAGLSPGRLELELTEGVLVEDADAAEAAMVQLRAEGFHLALDDFGSGYSSLIYLRRFAFDKIKIDRGFLESMEETGESAILIHSIVHLGRALGLTVTAEGVETREQHRFLQSLGCHEIQGFLLSRPLPPDEVDRLLKGPGLLPQSIVAPANATAA